MEPVPDSLETRLRRLETEVAALKLEWTELLDKVLHRLQRAAKRDRDAIASPSEAPQSINGAGSGVGYPLDAKSALRARARALMRG